MNLGRFQRQPRRCSVRRMVRSAAIHPCCASAVRVPRDRPASGGVAVGLWVAFGQQRVQQRLRLRGQAAGLARMAPLRDAGNPVRPPRRRPVAHARLGTPQHTGDLRHRAAVRPQQDGLLAPPVAHRAALGLGRFQGAALLLRHRQCHRLPSCSCRAVYHLNPLSSIYLGNVTFGASQPQGLRCAWCDA
jgi:hypothetical protein